MKYVVLFVLLLCIIANASHSISFLQLPNIDEVQPTLIGGTPVDPKKFPAVLYTRQGGSRCTSTLIGDRTLITASHCVDDGGSAQFTIAGVNYSSKCNHHPDYDNNQTADWALCYVDKSVKNVNFESLSMNSAIPKVGEQILLTGYGCIKEGGGGGNDGILRIGHVEVIKTPNNGNWDIVTKGKTALCFGDSGGPAFYESNGKRWQISVNSRGNIKDTSYLSKTLANPVFSDWIAKWAANHSTNICGVSGYNCFKDNPQPTLEPRPDPTNGPIDPKDGADPSDSNLLGWLLIVGGLFVFFMIVYLIDKIRKKTA